MRHVPLSTFHRCVADHNGEHKVKDFSCLDQFFAMAQRYAKVLTSDPGNAKIRYDMTIAHLRTAQAALNGGQPSKPYPDVAEREFSVWSKGRDSDPEVPNLQAFLVRTQQREATAAGDFARTYSLLDQEVALLWRISVQRWTHFAAALACSTE